MDSEFYKLLPKLELHAHLNGSLSVKTLKQLYISDEKIKEFSKLNEMLELGRSATLAECFDLFKIAHNATSNPEAVTKGTEDVITECYDDGIIYLELRTTPRKERNMPKELYIDSVLKGIQICQMNIPGIMVKLILSLDRKQHLTEATENVDLILKYHQKYPDIVRGLDVSGDPTKGDWFEPLCNKVRCESDLKITIHCAEVPNANEVDSILDFSPDRIGHGTCIRADISGRHWNKLIEKKIPVECCLTSNIKCRTVQKYSEHHIKQLMDAGHPFTIATDDKGVFATSLSQEYQIVKDTFGLSNRELWNMNFKSIEYAFCREEEKFVLRNKLNEWAQKHLTSDSSSSSSK